MGENDWGKQGLIPMGKAMLSKTLIQFSVDGWSCVPSLLCKIGMDTEFQCKIGNHKTPRRKQGEQSLTKNVTRLWIYLLKQKIK